LFISIVMLVLVGISCGTGGDVSQAVNATLTAIALQTPSPTATPADLPEKAAAIWLDALLNLDGNVLAQRTCRAQREAVKTQAMWDSALTAMGQLLVGQKTEGDISGLKFSLEADSGDKARIRVMGDLSTAVLGTFETQEVDETWLMVREDGMWRWCGGFGMPLAAGPTITPQPTTMPTVVSQPLRLIPYEIDTPPEIDGQKAGEGWQFVVVKFAVENLSDHPMRFELNQANITSAQLTTVEGYTYPVFRNWYNRLLPAYLILPAHFRTKEMNRLYRTGNTLDEAEFRLIFKTAQGTHLDKLHIPDWEDVDLSGPLENPRYPTDRSAAEFLSMNAPLDIPGKGEIVVLSAQTVIDLSRQLSLLSVALNYRNSSGGYEQTFDIGLSYIGDDGVLTAESWRQPMLPGAVKRDGTILVGPSQEVVVVHTFAYRNSLRDVKLVVAGDTAEVVNLDVKPPPPLKATPLSDMRSSWSGVRLNGIGDLNAIWGSSGTDVFAVGDNGLIIHYDGNNWSLMGSGTPDLDISGVWGTHGSDVFAVGSGGMLLHYDGNSWSRTSLDGIGDLNAIWGSSATDVFAVGDNGLIIHYDGDNWSLMGSGTTDLDMSGVWGTSGTDVFAVGKHEHTGGVLHYDGDGWSAESEGPVNAIWGSSANDVWAIGESGTILHKDGESWVRVGSVNNENLQGIWSCSVNDVWSVGESGTILRYDGDSWTTVEVGVRSDEIDLRDIWGSSPNDIWSVGRGGTILHYGGQQGKVEYKDVAKPCETVEILEPGPTESAAQAVPAGNELKLGVSRTRETDGMLMVAVPFGDFRMGTTGTELENVLQVCKESWGRCEVEWFDSEQPALEVGLDKFWLDRTEVSNEQFARFLNEAHSKSGNVVRLINTDSFRSHIDKVDDRYMPEEGYSQHPVTSVSWEGASEYCQWIGGRLPTEAEWEYAARGPEARVFPWGNEFYNACLNYTSSSDGYIETAPVGSFQNGASWSGALDMAGNVSEWTADWFGRYEDKKQQNPRGPASGQYRIHRGGSYLSEPVDVRCASRHAANPSDKNHGIGFRCVLPNH